MVTKESAKKISLPGAFELFSKSYEIIKKNFEVFMILFSVGGLVALWETLARVQDEEEQGRDWNNILANGVFGPDVNTGVYAAGGFMALVFFLYLITYLMLTVATLRAAQGNKLSLRQVWEEFTGSWLWLKLPTAIILMGLAIGVGLILLIIPGVILIWRLFFVPYVLIDQKTSISEAFARSWEMTRGYAWPVYSVILVTLLLSLANIMPVVGSLAAFILTSIYMVAPALRYQEIKQNT